MRTSAAVNNGGTAIQMFLFPDARVGYRSVGLADLRLRDTGQARPEAQGAVEIKALVQVQAESKPRLVDGEELTQPRTKERDDSGIAIGEFHSALSLSPLTRVQGRARHQERVSREIADPPDAVEPKGVNLSLLPALENVRTTATGLGPRSDRKSTRLNSIHGSNTYAVF